MQTSLYLVDAFSDAPFTGNPAGVCLLEEAADPVWMQQVAMEMNQAETAFVHPREAGFGLRWFTPLAEVDLCGHATLASAHVLWEVGALSRSDAAVFHTRSGELRCENSGHEIRMDFPSEGPVEEDLPPELAWLQERVVWYGENRMDAFAELESEQAVRDLKPDLDSVSRLGSRGLIVTARSEAREQDFVSRFFAPQFGVPEDPVTGSAHCALAPFWSARLGYRRLTGYQASPRGGFVGVESLGERVALYGRARTFLKGSIAT